MGFIDAIKGLFHHKAERVEIPLEQLQQWFDQRTEHKYAAKDETVKALYDQFDARIKELADKLAVLEVAELHNKNLPPKMLAYMVGNKNNYIRQVRMLLDSMPKFGKDFPEKFQKVLDDFTKKTQKSYVILQEFFANETRAIAQTIRDMDKIARQIAGTTAKGDILKIENINQLIARIHEKQKEQEVLKEKINSTQKEINGKQKEYNDLLESIKRRRESKQYMDVMHLKELVSEQIEHAEKIEKEINQTFAPLARAFRKYKRVTVDHEKLVEKYLDDPIKALLKDPKLRIIKAIDGIEESLDKLGFDKKERKKIEEKLASITKDRLDNMLGVYSELKATIGKTQEKIDEYRIIEEITQLEMDKDAMQNNINRLNAMIDNDLKKISELDTGIEHLASQVEEGVKSMLSIDLKIRVEPQELKIERSVHI